MIVTIKVKDETYEKYLDQNKKNPRGAIEAQIERFQDVGPGDRSIILSDEQRKKIEALRGMTFNDGEELVSWLLSRASIDVSDVKVSLRDGQLKYIKSLSDHYKRPLNEEIATHVKRAIDRDLGLS